MPIHFVQGKPGSGKSRYATGKIIDELVEGRRNIVTNLPLKLDRLNVYLQKQYPDVDCRMLQRLRILSDDDLRFFYKFRSTDDPEMPKLETIRPAEEVKDGMKAGDVKRILADQEREANERRERDKVLQCMPQSKLGENGVAYFLDEAHIAFNARNWAATGTGAINYLSQHRKLSDIVWPITQDWKNIDGQFVRVAEDFTVLRNEYTAKFGPFRGRGRFVRRTYLSPPSGTQSEPFETATFTLDPDGIASCYDTAKGIGVHGSKADIGRRAKGWSIWWAIPLGLGICSLAGIIPWFMSKGAGYYITGGAKKDMAAKLKGAPELAPGHGEEFRAVGGAGPTRSEGILHAPSFEGGLPLLADAQPAKIVWVRGWAQRGRKLNVLLTDGRTLTEEDGTIDRRTRSFVDFKNGDRIWLMTPPSSGSEGAGGESPPDRRRAGAATDAVAQGTDRDAVRASGDEARTGRDAHPFAPSSAMNSAFGTGAAAVAPEVSGSRNYSSYPRPVSNKGANDFRPAPVRGRFP